MSTKRKVRCKYIIDNNNMKNNLLEPAKTFLCLLIGFACFFINIISDELIGGFVRILGLCLMQCGINEYIAFITTQYITANLLALLAYILLKRQNSSHFHGMLLIHQRNSKEKINKRKRGLL